MASFFNVGGLGGNPFSTPVGQRIEQATDSTLSSENWALNMEICDMINESSDTARDGMKAIRKRLSQNAGKNNQVIMYTLTVLETCVKNCGKAFHMLVAQKDFIQELVKLIGPKNDPPAALQEKVLSLIQVWADAFKNQPDLNGVNQVYMELKNKGIEFPQTDMDTMAPIYTPQRSVPEVPMQQQMAAQQAMSPQHASAVGSINGPVSLSPEQTTKLQSELEIVSHSMSILGEMLTELKPGYEEVEDYTLLTELTATCKEMQGRIVDLIGRINDDELTAELLRLNDELNNLFLRHQRYEKNRSSSTATSPSAILGAAIGVPTAASAAAASSATTAATTNPAQAIANQRAGQNEQLLIDLEKSDHLSDNFSQLSTKSGGTAIGAAADEFDMLAQSRTDASGNMKNDILRDIPTVDAKAGSIGSPFKTGSGDNQGAVLPAKDNEVDEMEAWLGNTKEIEGMEETLTSTEFDKFLEERAAAAESLPTITATNNATAFKNSNTNNLNSSGAGSGGSGEQRHAKKKDDADLLAL